MTEMVSIIISPILFGRKGSDAAVEWSHRDHNWLFQVEAAAETLKCQHQDRREWENNSQMAFPILSTCAWAL